MDDVKTFYSVPVFGSAADKVEPAAPVYSGGYIPDQLLPSEHFNWFINGITYNDVELMSGTNSVLAELKALLTAASITPDPALFTQVMASLNVLYRSRHGHIDGSYTNGQIYALLSPHIPTIGDKMPLNAIFYLLASGSFDRIDTAVVAERLTSTTMLLSGFHIQRLLIGAATNTITSMRLTDEYDLWLESGNTVPMGQVVMTY